MLRIISEQDAAVDRIALIGEFGGTSEIAAANFIKQHISKPSLRLRRWP